MVNENVQILTDSTAVSDLTPMPIKRAKGQTVTLFGGAISASVAETAATVIDLTDYTGGSLEYVVNSGTGTFSVAIYVKETATGVFNPLYVAKADNSGVAAYPAIVTTASTSISYSLYGINANYVKFVPTITGTVNATFKFTPAN